jgi:serine/threonine-protein kinase
VSFYQGSQKRPPERLADRFRVLDEIGAGATAITYRGWDERLERSVAIKILRASVALDPTFVRRFQQEARAAASVSHGNVVDVYDFGQQDDALYIVMQYVEGEDLKHLITREGALPVDRAREIAGQVLDGLRAIHAAGIVHRDIKPQNVLIGRDGVARLTDFGVAQVAEDSGMTTAGTTVGTAAYMAPEQAQAGRITEATDLYAVGVMLYEMLTGFLPFNAPTAVAMMLQHIQEAPVPPSQRLPGRGIPRALDSVVMQALAKNPADRFNSALAMKQAVFARGQGGYGDSQTTVSIPAARPLATTALPRQQASARPPIAPRAAATGSRAVPPRSVAQEGAGLRSVVGGLLLVVLLAIGALAGWYFYDDWRNNQAADDPATPTATSTATAEVTQEAPTHAPTEEEVPPTSAPTEEPAGIIEPIEATEAPEPTATSEPTPEPTAEPTATSEPSPTPEPTEEPTLEPTEEVPIIEPIGGASDAVPLAQETGDGATYAMTFDDLEAGFAITSGSTPVEALEIASRDEQLVFAFVANGEPVEYAGVPVAQGGKLKMKDMEQTAGSDEGQLSAKALGKALEDGVNDYFAGEGLRIEAIQVTDSELVIQTQGQ